MKQGNEIKSLNLKREDIVKQSRDRKLKLDKVFNKIIYQRFREGGNIGFDQMAEHPVGENFEFPSLNDANISSARVLTCNKDTLMFITNFDRGAILKRHVHNDCHEYLKVPEDCDGMFLVVSGRESDGTLEYTVLTSSDDEMFVPAGLVHQVSNISRKSCRLVVKFERSRN